MPAITADLNSFRPQFENAWDIAYSQTPSLLRGAVDSKPGVGKSMQGQILNTEEMDNYNTRGGDTVYSDLDSDLWNVFPQPAEKANLIDEWDEAYLAQLGLPTNEIVQIHAGAVSRKIDDTIVTAMTAAAFRGTNGTTSTAFDTTNQQIAVTYKGPITPATCGLNFYKIAHAAKIMDDNEVPANDRYLGIRAAAMEDLVNDVIQNHSTELSSIKSMAGNNRVFTEILGFKVIQAQRFTQVTSTDIATAVAWQKSAMQLILWGDRKTTMAYLPMKRDALSIRTCMNVGATRKRDGGVVSILVDQSP